MRGIFFFAICTVLSCGAPMGAVPGHPSPDAAGASALKMQHQILFHNGADDHVFEGIMFLFDDAYIVKAFAGPGVELFTVARSGNRHREILHLEALKDRIDVAKIGEDIAYVYRHGCVGPKEIRAPGPVECIRDGLKLIETMDARGLILERWFTDAHGVGLHIDYAEYVSEFGKMMPKSVTLRWGKSERSLVIKTVLFERAAPADRALVENFLQ